MKTVSPANPVYRSLNKPLLILGVERRLFFLSMVMGAATFNFFGSLLGGIGMTCLLYFASRLATAKDRELPRIVLNAGKFRNRYDPAKRRIASPERRNRYDQS